MYPSNSLVHHEHIDTVNCSECMAYAQRQPDNHRAAAQESRFSSNEVGLTEYQDRSGKTGCWTLAASLLARLRLKVSPPGVVDALFS